jgi:hypothetical protein
MRLEVHAMLRGTAVFLFFALVSLATGAGADATFALQWRDTGTQSLTILPGDAAAGGQRTLDILMTLDVQWIGFGVSVGLPEGSSLSFAGGGHWDAVSVPDATWAYPGPPMALNEYNFAVLESYGIGPYQEGYEYATLMNPPAGPPWAPPGTYVVGWAFLDTSAVLSGETVETFFQPTVDGLAIDDGTGTPVFSDDATFLNATLGTAQLFVVPEPATGALVAAGLLLLGLAGHRRSLV